MPGLTDYGPIGPPARPMIAGVSNVTLDLSGANVPGVAEFKRQFGARLVPTMRVRRVGPRWLRAVDALRR